MHEQPFQSLILDCDFCDNAEHFTDFKKAVDEGWNWMSSEYKDGSEIETVACSDCDADKVSERHDKKNDLITYSESEKPSDSARRDPGQTCLADNAKTNAKGEN